MTSPRHIIEYVHADVSDIYSPEEIKGFIEVDQGDFEVGNSAMMSEGFYNCVALIGISKSVGLLGHFQSIDNPEAEVYNEFGNALRALAEIEAHTVILAGSYIFDGPVDFERATLDRAAAESDVRAALPKANLVINWNEEYVGRQDIIVHPDSGRVVIHNATSNFVV